MRSLGAPPAHVPYMRVLMCLVLLFMQMTCGDGVSAEEAETTLAEQDPDQSDIYYDAMIRSIELDTGHWKSFSRSMESGPWFYDTQSLKREGGTVTALVTVYPHPNRTELYRSVYPEHTRIRKIVFATEINCSKRTYRQPQISVHSYFNELLAEHLADVKKQSFTPIKPGTTTDTLRSLICSPDKKKRH